MGQKVKVRVIQLGQDVFEFVGEVGLTVGQVIGEGGFIVDGLRTDVRVNGDRVSLDYRLEDGNTVTIIPPIKGGYGGWVGKR